MVGFLFWPNTGSSELNPEEIIKNQEQIELKEKDAEDILKSLIQKISDEWIEVTTSSNFILEEQAVLVILSKGIKINAMRYLLLDVPIEIGKVVIKATIKVVNLILAEDPSLIIDEVEKLTVKKAKEYAINWLLQNEIKVTKGNLKVSYFAYNRKWQKVIFPYIIVYRPLTPTRGEVGINIYSSDFIKTPLPLSGYQWEGGVEELPPFIVKISGEVEKSKTTHYVYSWVKGPEINIDFSGPVPEFEFKEPGFFDKLELSLNKVEVILGKIMDFVEIGDAWNKVKSFLSEISSFTAIMTPDSSSFEDPELDFSEIDLENLPSEEKLTSEVEEIIEKEKELSELVQEIEAISEASSGAEGMGLDEIQEIIDDIAERIDVINQEIHELVGEIQQTPEEITDETEELTEESEEGEKEEKEEEEEEKVGQKEIGQEMSDLCQKIEGNYPAQNKIIFNEVAWMGTLESANDEWIELKNISGGEVNLTGWQLLDKEQQIKIIFDSKDRASVGGFYLLERTDDDSVPRIAADFVYTGGLNNTNEALYLFDENCQLQDEIEAFPDWPAGDNSSKRTMERKSNLGWQASVRSGGTPKRENSSGYIKTSGGGGGGGGGGESAQPKITLSYSEDNPVNKEIETTLSLADFKNALYDVKISIEKEDVVLSEIYNQKEDKWQSSHYYLKEVFSGKSFEGELQLKTVEEKNDFRGEADIFAKIRENGKTTIYAEFSGKINITDPESELGEEEEEEEEEKEEEEPSRLVVINEIAWMGTEVSLNDEWIELYNPNSEPVELLDWQLLFYSPEKTEPRTTAFSILETTTPAIDGLGYFLLERTGDETVSDVEADYIYTGPLNNDGGVFELRDENGDLIDKIDCSEKWFAGDNETKQTMERINPELLGSDSTNWADNNLITRNGKDANGNNINGTPKTENSVSKSSTEISGIVDFPALTLLGNPYIVEGTVVIPENKTLTIEPGVVIKFHGYYSENTGMTVNGTLKAIGGEIDDEKIVFTSYRDEEYGGSGASHGSWGQIYFSPTSAGSELENIILRYGGGFYDPGQDCSGDAAGIRVQESSITLKNSVLEHNKNNGLLLINSSSIIDNVQFLDTAICQGFLEHGGKGISINGGGASIKNSLFEKNIYGIYINKGQDSPATPIIENNIFEENEKPIWVIDSSPSIKGNQAINNDINGAIVSGEISLDTVWEADLTYIIEGGLTISPGVVFTLKPGVVIKVHDCYRGNGRIIVNGILKAIGAEDEKIIFTSFFDDDYGGDTNSDGGVTSPSHGSWGQIYFSPTSAGSELENIILRYGGGFYDPGRDCSIDAAGIRVQESSITLKNSVLEHSKNNGLLLINSSSIIDNVQFLDTVVCQGYHEHGGNGISINGDSPVTRNSLFERNVCGIYIQNGDPILEIESLVFGIGNEANGRNIYKDGECINPE